MNKKRSFYLLAKAPIFMTCFFMSATFMLACTSPGSRSTEAKMPPPEATPLDTAIKNLESGHYEVALSSTNLFLKAHPNSIFTQRALLLKAEALEGLGHIREAADIYHSVYHLTQGHNPSLAAEALYGLSLNYATQGNDLQALATLEDLEARSQDLPFKTARVEIAARRVLIFTLRGQNKEAKSELRRAERELGLIRAQMSREDEQRELPRCYYFMGSLSLEPLTIENVFTYLDSFEVAQGYLFRSTAYPNSRWGERSKKTIQEHYKKLMQTYMQILSQHPGPDQRERVVQIGSRLSEIFHFAQLLIPEAPELRNSYQIELAQWMRTFEELLDKIHYQPGGLNPLTKTWEPCTLCP